MAELIAYELETDLFVANGQLRFCGWEAEIGLNLDPALSAAMPAYEIGSIIGRGTYGIVYAATHRLLGREVAIKQLWPDLMSNAEARTRFAMEARLLASLDHVHIVRAYDYVETDVYALVLERLTGGTLHERRATGPVSPRQACEVALTVLSALAYLHGRGFVHRDVKPQNLLSTEAGLIKLADFGLARAIAPEEPRASVCIAGTPAYMAPEQVDPTLGPVSPATDVWAVGVMLNEMLGGESDVPGALTDVVAKAMARVPSERLQTAEEFARELLSVISPM